MYTVQFKTILNYATNLLVNGALANELLALQATKPEAKELFVLEGPVQEFSNQGEAKIVAYDWEGFTQRFIAKLPEQEQSQYHDFVAAIETLKAAA